MEISQLILTNPWVYFTLFISLLGSDLPRAKSVAFRKEVKRTQNYWCKARIVLPESAPTWIPAERGRSIIFLHLALDHKDIALEKVQIKNILQRIGNREQDSWKWRNNQSTLPRKRSSNKPLSIWTVGQLFSKKKSKNLNSTESLELISLYDKVEKGKNCS